MGNGLAHQLIAAHLVEGQMRPGEEIALKIDQFLLHDGTGPLCALQLEAMGVEEVCGDIAVAYCDHLLVEADSKNADDHILLQSAARRCGMWFSRPGNGTSHPVHQQRFGIPGKTLLGADSHTPAAGGIKISHPSDSFEQAAESSADRAMAGAAPLASAAAPGAAQRVADDDAEVQGIFVQREEEELDDEKTVSRAPAGPESDEETDDA